METIEREICEALDRRRAAWRRLSVSNKALRRMAPDLRDRVDDASVSFRMATRKLTTLLAKAGSPVTLADGTTLRLNEYGDGPSFVAAGDLPPSTDLIRRRKVRRLVAADARRSGRGRAS